MKYEVYFPPNNLRSVVKHFVVIHSLQDLDKLLFLPNGGNFIIFNRGIKARTKSFCGTEITQIPLSYSVSLKSNSVKEVVAKYNYANESKLPIILVELLPLGFYKLFKKDASSLQKKYFELDKQTIKKHFSKLYRHKNIDEELKYLSVSLTNMLVPQCGTDLCVNSVVQKIHHEYFDVQVQDLLNEFNCSRSTMERHFKRKVGLTPKNYILISKFSNTLIDYVQKKKTFHELEYIYSDNSHMNATFKKFLGVAPSDIFLKIHNKEYSIYQINSLKREKLMNSY